jgi:hypothetical protein
MALQRCLGPLAGKHSWRHPNCGFDSGALRQNTYHMSQSSGRSKREIGR